VGTKPIYLFPFLTDSRSSIWENGKYPVRLILNGQASKEIEWHCKHYVGRGLMKRFGSGEALAKEMKLDPSVLKATFDKYNKGVREKNDPFGKKVCFVPCLSLWTLLTLPLQFFHGGEWRMDDFFHVALMTPVLHYTMGGLAYRPRGPRHLHYRPAASWSLRLW
jgi:hypothetical protein